MAVDVVQPSTLRTLALSAHFIGLMVVSNVLEEYLYSRVPGFDFYATVAAVELAAFSAAAWASSRRGGEPRRAPLVFYAFAGLAMAGSQSFGKVANKYVNFSVSTVFKCSKGLPTMGVLAVLGRRYDRYEVAAVAAMGGAAACFALGASRADAAFSAIGLVYNFAYLVFQAAMVAAQDVALRDYGAGVDELMAHANAFGLLAVGATACYSGELPRALAFFYARRAAAALLLVRTATFYAAVRSYTHIIKEAGGVAAVTVGIARKILTIACSLVLYPKPFHVNYLFGALLFFAALALEWANGSRAARRKAPPPRRRADPPGSRA